MDLGEEPVQDYLLDQEVGLATLQGVPGVPIYCKAPYKQMPNFGTCAIGQSGPLLSVTKAAMDCEEVGLSHIDCPLSQGPGPAVTSSSCGQ